MTRRPIIAAALYAGAALALCTQTVYADRRGDTAAVVVLGCCAVLAGLALIIHTVQRDTIHLLRAHAAAVARPHRGPTPDEIADEITLGLAALAEACCLPAAVSAGREHDPAHCTRKDTTT